MAGIAAAESGARTVICEQLDRPGVKLLATGGGRCNLCNTLDLAPFMAAFGRQGRFMQPALAGMDAVALRGFFEQLGVPTDCPNGRHVYPATHSAATVQKALWDNCLQLGVAFRFSLRATGLRRAGGVLEGLECVGTSPASPPVFIPAGRVILATGGSSYPQLGGTGGGYELARQTGHEVVPPQPALVPLLARDKDLAACAGVSLSPARIWIDAPRQAKAGVTGDILFTHTGLSGPAVLDISGEVAELLGRQPEVTVRIDLTPGQSAESWLTSFDAQQHTRGAGAVRGLLARHVPASLAEVLCRRAKTEPQTQLAQLSRPRRRALAELLTALPVTVVGTEGFGKAMVTRGGVSLRQVDPATLESRLCPGLFFAGELLDLAGPCGGFNLHWAFAAGRLAGLSAARPRP